MRFIQSGWKYMLVLVLCGCWILLFNPLKWLLPARNNFFHMPALISTLLNSLGAPLQISGVLCVALSSLVHCPVNPTSLDCPWTVHSIFSTQVIHWVVPGYPLFVPWFGNSLKVVSQGSCRTHIICFPLLGDHYTSLPDAQYLENCSLIFLYILPFFTFFCLFVFFRQEGKLVPYYSIFAGSRSSKLVLN